MHTFFVVSSAVFAVMGLWFTVAYLRTGRAQVLYSVAIGVTFGLHGAMRAAGLLPGYGLLVAAGIGALVAYGLWWVRRPA